LSGPQRLAAGVETRLLLQHLRENGDRVVEVLALEGSQTFFVSFPQRAGNGCRTLFRHVKTVANIGPKSTSITGAIGERHGIDAALENQTSLTPGWPCSCATHIRVQDSQNPLASEASGASICAWSRIWWNWQTRYFEVVVPQGVQVQVLLSAPLFLRKTRYLTLRRQMNGYHEIGEYTESGRAVFAMRFGGARGWMD